MYKSEVNIGLIDLHLHLDGSLSVRSVRELAQMQGRVLPQDDQELLEQLQVDRDCRDLNEYLEKFSFPCALLQTRQAITMAVANLLGELKAQGLLYAEIRFAPQLHTQQGLTQMEVVRAAIDGLNQCDFRANLILCCMRGSDNREQNNQTIQVASHFLGQGVCAVDLAGAEALYPTADFEDLLRTAREKGIPLTIHAGEAAGADSVWAALKLCPKRIGHGVRSLEDELLLKQLAAVGTTLELCPTSNLNTNIFPGIQDYPLRRLMEAGVRVTINTDNMTVSNVTVRSEMEKAADAFSLSMEEIAMLEMNAADACFANGEVREWLRCQIRSILGLDLLGV